MNSSNLGARLSARGVLQLQEGWWILKCPTMTWSVVTLCDTLLAVVDVCDKMEMRSSSKELVIGGIGLRCRRYHVGIKKVMQHNSLRS